MITLLTLLATPAWAANVLQTRVGVHDEYTRIVFELDAPAGYQIERKTLPSGGSELVVSLDAFAESVSLSAPKSDVVSGVDLVPADRGSVAHIRLASDRIRLKEMILANPPRIVLDVVAETPAPVAVSTPSQAAEPVVDEAPKQMPAATPPLLADSPSDEAPAVDETMDDAPVPASAAPVMPAARPKETPKSSASPQKLAMASPTPSAAPMKREMPSAAAAPSARPAPRPLPRAPRKLPPAPAAAPAPAASGGMFGFDYTTIGLAAVGLIGLLAAGALLMRRGGSSDEDLDEASGEDPFAGFDSPSTELSGQAETQMIPPGEDHDLPAPLGDDSPAVKGLPVSKLGPAASSGFEPDDAPTQAVTAIGGDDDLFGTAAESAPSVGEAEPSGATAETMVLNVPDHPGADTANSGGRTMSNFETVSNFGASSAAPMASGSQDPSAASNVDGLERRLVQTEKRLDEALEAAERLERTVTAQTEELRVQRAAIARTQRAVRNLSRGEDADSSATEPAPKGPAQ